MNTIRLAALAAENVRGGYLSVNPRQWGAALSMNMNPWSALWRIVLPQSWARDPAAIDHAHHQHGQGDRAGFADRLSRAHLCGPDSHQRGFSARICYGTVLILYFVVSWGFARFGRYAEKRLVTDARHPHGVLAPQPRGAG